ncbi:WYL domain-containing protein [Paenibacillus sp. LHD-117]|uniref:helix-turn-helix transcriptional regulator n=1 Tax=Paenibacillus sp. LHD-117 TaxID=3071412 RepID=UPI0027DF63B1|nr:WYL domain-containing protein [Paenibacillus sp. LHD-117]MDQ6419993.1 WYL domain-containing protein [Paenibacillus sp. LHD-117]
MARESFDKEIQFLRMLALASGAYSRQQYAERLGISVHTFDKMMKRLKEIAASVLPARTEAQEAKEMAELLRFSYLDAPDPLLLFLFRAKSLKESETERLSCLLASLKDGHKTAMELLDDCCAAMSQELAPPDEKTIRGDLKYLEGVGVIRREPGPRPYRYGLWQGFAESLTAEELLDLHDYASMMANTRLPSVQGYLLKDTLKKRLMGGHGYDAEALDAFLYKYHYHSRVLDEAHLFSLFEAIGSWSRVSFHYFSPKKETSYASRNTNPLYQRESDGSRESCLPLKIVYDHQYGRWYLLGWGARHGVKKYRLEGVTELKLGEAAEEAEFAEKLKQLESRIRHSWLIDTGRKTLVRLRFYKPGPSIPDFVRERVIQQGQWGEITDEREDSFIYEIEVNGTIEIKPWIRSFGSSCEVLEPARLREELIDEWKELARYYESL